MKDFTKASPEVMNEVIRLEISQSLFWMIVSIILIITSLYIWKRSQLSIDNKTNIDKNGEVDNDGALMIISFSIVFIFFSIVGLVIYSYFLLRALVAPNLIVMGYI
jgi:hypothetical protein